MTVEIKVRTKHDLIQHAAAQEKVKTSTHCMNGVIAFYALAFRIDEH